ncbi:hypothetical protein L873DRAFT_1822592 [Choiromyces venosus 120613-1]|uniref:Uncharacterized protein n=1 Tax=Choiromyces venosus 120613-1 TaxID=1336337 RepID=A0A3N4J6Q8_9PEZI|nr:hypothetical protein L873DRAFT_1822592 [Choiromyces venosus 120613-1]
MLLANNRTFLHSFLPFSCILPTHSLVGSYRILLSRPNKNYLPICNRLRQSPHFPPLFYHLKSPLTANLPYHINQVIPPSGR